MILGIFDSSTYTALHVVISLIGLATGVVILKGLLGAQRMEGWTAAFLASTVLTSATGFGFPFNGFLPSHGVGIVSLVVLLLAILGLYVFRLAGAWRWIYVACAVLALWLNYFVLVAQGFSKLPALHALAPTQSEPPFLIAQTVVMAAFAMLTLLAVRRFHPERADAGASAGTA